MGNCVIRTDLMSGTTQPADLVSLRFYNSETPAQVENGVIAKLVELETGEREVWKAVAATSSDKLSDCVVIAGVEVMYDERKKNLDDYVNEAGKITRGYILRSRNEFSVTKEGFVGATPPALKDEVGIGTGGKIDPDGTGLGTCVAIETAGRYTYYTIKLANTEAASV